MGGEERGGEGLLNVLKCTGGPCAVLGGNFGFGCVNELCVWWVGEGNGLLPPIRQGAKRSGRSALSEICSCRFGRVISCFRPRASVVSYTLHSERTSARYMGRAWPASMPLSSRAVTELMRAGGPCAVLGGNFCLGFVSGVALPPPFRQGARISDRGALWDSFSCLLGKVISYFRFWALTASNTV